MSRRSFSLPGRLALLGAAGALVLGIVVPSVQALPPPGAGFVDPFTSTGLADLDTRTGTIAPTAAQLAEAAELGATVRWNRFGTPASLVNHDGDLGGALGTTEATSVADTARAWLNDHRVLFGGNTSWAAGLELVQNQKLGTKAGNAVLFRQRFGELAAAVDGLVTVGLTDGSVRYVSSSIAKTTAAPAAATLTATAAWKLAAQNIGRSVVSGAIGSPTDDPDSDWTVFGVDGFAQPQRARLRALPAPSGQVVAVYEANVVDVAGAKVEAYTSFVDARSGRVLVRHNQVDNAFAPQSEFAGPFQGVITATVCGPRHPFLVDAATKTITVGASAANVANDIVLNLYGPGGGLLISGDTGTSPEAVTYSPPGGVPAGTYEAEVCPFDDPTVPFLPPGDYVGVFVASEQEAPDAGIPYPPVWDYFVANPLLDYDSAAPDNRLTGCWVTTVDGSPVPGCDNPPSPLNNLAARAPWDFDIRTQVPTFTTDGNAASTAEAWVSPLTPGGTVQRPIEPDRTYQAPFVDAWNDARCSQTELVPGGNDILASVTHLFASHNRMHDFSYFLGFTEANYNMQKNNFGLTGQDRAQDPEIGNVQAGAISGGAPSYLGRDNANQITLQDGIPGITNQYLFQPIAGAFYAPCVDGDLDFSIVGHEYTHAISNRMVAGPDAGLSGFQAGSMGESWSDQVAQEYQIEHDYDMGTDSPWVVGPYATGNFETGIRNYALDANPLQYGDLGYDITGPEVHADGEVWSAVMYDVRQALVRKFDGRFPSSDVDLQRRCSQGDTTAQPPEAPLQANRCPGNRRWIQLMFDSFLLQQSATSMLDARDAYLAADQMRFGGRNQTALWKAFAKNGMGENASTEGTEDDQPVPDYTSPLSPEGTLEFSATAMDLPGQPEIVGAKLYLGRYEARVTPIADTDPMTDLGSTVSLVPGTYQFVLQADGYGLRRFTRTVVANQTIDQPIHPVTNIASMAKGATIDGSSVGSVNTSKLIDDTEASNWAGINPPGVSVDTLNPFVNVDLMGNGAKMVRSVNVSAMLRPADPGQEEDPNQPDDGSRSRFTALRQFAIETCTESVTSDCSSLVVGTGSPYSRIFTSEVDAFDATAPRPLAPDLLFKKFDVPDTAATHVRLVALQNQCSGAPEYAGEQDDDLLNATDCKLASDRDESVRAAELQVFEFDQSTVPPGDPVVVMTKDAPATAAPGEEVTYELTYTNLGPLPSAKAKITDVLPAGVEFVSGTDRARYDAETGTVRWRLGTVALNVTDSVELTVRMPTVPGVVLNQAQFSGALTHSAPAAAVTVVLE